MAPTVTPASNPPAATLPLAEPEVAASPNLAQPTTSPAQAPQTIKAHMPQPVQSPASSPPAGSGNTNDGPQPNPTQAAAKGQGTPNNAPAADPNQGPASNGPGQGSNSQPAGSQEAPAAGTNQAPASNDPSQGSNQQPAKSQKAPAAGPNQAPASQDPGQSPNNQPAGSGTPAAPVATDTQEAALTSQPIPQTTINISGTQPSPALGGIIYSAINGGPPQRGTAEGGSTSGGTGGVPGESSGASSGGSSGGSPDGNSGGSSGGTTGGTSGSAPGGHSGGSSAGSAGGSSEGTSEGASGTILGGSPAGSSEGTSGGAPGGSSGDTSGGTTGGTSGTSSGGSSGGAAGGTSGGSAGGSSGGSPDQSAGGSFGNSQGGTQSGSQGGNAQPNAPGFTPHAVTALGQTLSAINPSAVAIAGKTLSAGGPAFSSNGNFYSVGPSGNLVAGTLAPGATPAPVLTFAGSAYTANSASQFVIAGQTLSPGAKITISGTPVSLASGASNVAIIGSSTQALSMITPAPAQAPALLTFDGSTYTANSASQFVIAGQTLNPGQQITVSGVPISLAPSGVSSNFAIVGGSTQSLQGAATAAAQAPALLTFDSSTYTANSLSQFIIAGKTLTPGGSMTVFGTPMSEGSGGSFAVIGTSTQALQTPGMTTAPALMTFNGQTYTANSGSEFVIAGQTLAPGGAITVSGTPISEAASGSGLVAIGSSTQVLGHVEAMITNPAMMTFNGPTYTANAASEFVINGQTLTPGGVITVSGTPVSEAASGSGLVVVGSSTQVLGHASAGVTEGVVMTFGGQTFTANAASDFVIGGQTLTPGGMITVSGTPISEAVGATDIVIGTSTEMLSTATTTPSAMAFVGGQMKLSVPSLAWLCGWLGLSIFSGYLFIA